MIRTRNSFKRTSKSSNESNKKPRLSNESDKLTNTKGDDDEEEEEEEKSDLEDIDDVDDTDEDSDYKPSKNDKSSDSGSDNETESHYFKSTNKFSFKNTISSISFNKINNYLSPSTSKEFKKEKFGHNLESDSSSDEFERAPISLEELGDFKKINQAMKDHNSDSDNDTNNPAVKESDYFDFTQIIERQELYKTVGKLKNDDNNVKKNNDSTCDKSKERNKEYVKTKYKRFKKSTGDTKQSINNDDVNVMELLKLGETTSKSKNLSDDSDSGDEDEGIVSRKENEIKNIQVTIELPGMSQKKDKTKSSIEAAIKRRFNLIKKENQIFAHKVHVLCWIAHGNYINDILNSPELLGLALSLIPSKHCYPPKRCDLTYLQNLVEWFTKKIKIVDPTDITKIKDKRNHFEILQEQLTKQLSYSKKYLVLMFICVVRALGLTARLIINLRPVPVKPPINELCVLSNKQDSSSNKKHNVKKEKSKDDEKKPRVKKSKYFKNDPKTVDNNDKTDNKKSVKPSTSTSLTDKQIKEVEKRKSQRNKPSSSSNNDTNKKTKSNKKSKVVEMESSENDDEESSDDEFVPKTQNKRKSNLKNNKEKIDRRVLSSDDDNDNNDKNVNKKKKKNTTDEWAEVYLEAEEKWISCDLVRGKIHCIQHLYSSAAQPVTYVLGWENKHHIKDLTRRYVPHWMTVTRKQRAEADWWDETIQPYLPPNDYRNKEEDEELDKQLEDQPLPTSIGEYKNHPLYALQRHLLKFQAIYPPDAPTVGFIRKEPVYSRMCVVELHTRESWIKEAKLVRLGEQPYKIVKARPKYDKLTGQVIKDIPLNLYGHWQVEDYIPPPAVDGKVPRNEYGNVELYKPCMLPGGTVHLQLPALNRVAKKLNIDCAPAVVGWDFHSGGSHPILDGYIVCEEFKDVLLDAWNKEIDESAKRAKEKVEQRVYGNWKRIIKGLLIREKLKLRYNFEDPPEEPKSKKKISSRKSTKK